MEVKIHISEHPSQVLWAENENELRNYFYFDTFYVEESSYVSFHC